jgi:hypothetical protein
VIPRSDGEKSVRKTITHEMEGKKEVCTMKVYLKRLLGVCMMIAVVIIMGLQAKAGQAAEVLVIRDDYAWGLPYCPIERTLSNLGKTYVRMTSAGLKDLSEYDLSKYKIAIIASDQKDSYYTNLNDCKTKLHNAIHAGLVLIAHLCDGGVNHGSIDGYTLLPGGVEVSRVGNNPLYGTDTIRIVNGNCVVDGITTGSYFCNWYPSANGIFRNYSGVGAEEIMWSNDRDSYDGPTYIIYTYGQGKIMATTQAVELGYSLDKTQFLEKEVTCAQQSAQPDETLRLLQQVKTCVDSLGTRLSALETKCSTIEASVNGLSTAQIQTALSEIKTKSSSIETKVNSLSTDQIQTSLNEIEAKSSSIETKVNSLSTDQIQTSLNEIKTKASTIENSVKVFTTYPETVVNNASLRTGVVIPGAHPASGGSSSQWPWPRR